MTAQSGAYGSEWTARVLNGFVVTESESDDPQLIANLRNPLYESGRLLISKRQKLNQRKMRRLRVKAIAGQRFLSKRTSKRISKILAECNNIGKVIEDFVFEHSIGADAWCHMGVLTFDGNTCLPQKVTYERIRLHLQEVYKRHFSYGTVVQLCVARNKRRLSSKVTTRRARKGFTLKYNPDAHWSAAFYKGLNSIQLVDGQDMCLINRDNPAGYAGDLQTVCYTNCERQWNLEPPEQTTWTNMPAHCKLHRTILLALKVQRKYVQEL